MSKKLGKYIATFDDIDKIVIVLFVTAGSSPISNYKDNKEIIENNKN